MTDFIETVFMYVIAPILTLIAIVFLLGFVVFIGSLAMGAKTPAMKAYEQCLDDGQKEYVCYAMVYGRGAR